MPVFDEDDQRELAKILSGQAAEEAAWDLPDFDENIPLKKKMQKIQKAKADAESTSTPIQKAIIAKPLTKPNSDWRSASMPTPSPPSRSSKTISAEYSNPVKSSSSKNAEPASSRYGSSYGDDFDLSNVDLDYDDFAQAMFEVENAYVAVKGGGKRSILPIEHEGLQSGARLPDKVWSHLLDGQGLPFDYSMVHKNTTDVVVVHADPRRMTDEFKTVLNQLNLIPLASLKIGSIAINCDDWNDHRKFIKKGTSMATGKTCALVSDPSRKLMDAVKCRADKRLMSSIFLLEVATNKILKIWYENDWDPFTTKDMVIEEVKAYRKNPKEYVQSQIGIR